MGTLPATESFAKIKPRCGGCACGKKCCLSQSLSICSPEPATPASVQPLKHFQISLLPSAPAYSLPAFPTPAISFNYASSIKSIGVPVYDWNCAYLI